MFAVADFTGWLAWHILPKERRKVIQHLEIAFGAPKTFTEFNRIGRSVFQNLGKTVIDTLRIPKLSKQDLNALISESHVFDKIEIALKNGRGLICATGHIGNWELIPVFIASRGYEGGVIGRRIYYEPFNRVLEKIREGAGAKVFYRDESPKPILAALKKNQIVGVLPDQDVDSLEGIFVPFFGRLAYTPSAPAKLSIASGAPILPLFMIRAGGRYKLFCDEIIWPEAAPDKEAAVLKITQRVSDVIESYVRRYPEQWVWMHRRWRSRPKEEAKEKVQKST